ncbi:MAG: DUF6624 domain-containing protein [Phycisphaerae bacterium]
MSAGSPIRQPRRAAAWLVAAILAALPSCTAPRIPPELRWTVTRPVPTSPEALTDELAAMVEIDQKLRREWVSVPGGKNPRGLMRKLRNVDHANTERMKRIVAKLGWPTISEYGKKAPHLAWLLVQHAADPVFRSHCLDLMGPLLEKDEVRKDDFAYLTDRVLVLKGKAQRYGTQFHTVDGKLQPLPIEDAANVDARRKEMGMPPLAEYRASFKR